METMIIYYKIVRETSKYNKYIKWYAKCYRSNGEEISSFGYKTEKEARNSIDVLNGIFPIGNREINYIYEEMESEKTVKWLKKFLTTLEQEEIRVNYSWDDLKSDITTLLEDYTNKTYIVSEIMHKIEFYEECKKEEVIRKIVDRQNFSDKAIIDIGKQLTKVGIQLDNLEKVV